MSLADPIGDMLTRIRNGQMRSLNKIDVPFSNFRSKILDVLKKEGYILDFETISKEKTIKTISVKLKYYDGQPVIKEIKRISKPGRRVYSRATSIPKVLNGLGLAILKLLKLFGLYPLKTLLQEQETNKKYKANQMSTIYQKGLKIQ